MDPKLLFESEPSQAYLQALTGTESRSDIYQQLLRLNGLSRLGPEHAQDLRLRIAYYQQGIEYPFDRTTVEEQVHLDFETKDGSVQAEWLNPDQLDGRVASTIQKVRSYRANLRSGLAVLKNRRDYY